MLLDHMNRHFLNQVLPFTVTSRLPVPCNKDQQKEFVCKIFKEKYLLKHELYRYNQQNILAIIRNLNKY